MVNRKTLDAPAHAKLATGRKQLRKRDVNERFLIRFQRGVGRLDPQH